MAEFCSLRSAPTLVVFSPVQPGCAGRCVQEFTGDCCFSMGGDDGDWRKAAGSGAGLLGWRVADPPRSPRLGRAGAADLGPAGAPGFPRPTSHRVKASGALRRSTSSVHKAMVR